MIPTEPDFNRERQRWQEEEATKEYLDSLIFLGMPLEKALQTEAYSAAPQLRTPKHGGFLQRIKWVIIGVGISIIALLLTIGVSL